MDAGVIFHDVAGQQPSVAMISTDTHQPTAAYPVDREPAGTAKTWCCREKRFLHGSPTRPRTHKGIRPSTGSVRFWILENDDPHGPGRSKLLDEPGRQLLV